jgi:hypothetical protein
VSGPRTLTRQVLQVAAALKGGPRGNREGGKMDMKDKGNRGQVHRMGIGALLPRRRALLNELKAARLQASNSMEASQDWSASVAVDDVSNGKERKKK